MAYESCRSCFCQLLQKQRENFVHHHIAQFLFSCCAIIILSASGFVNAKMRLVISQFEGILRIMLKSSRILVYNKKKRIGGALYARMYKKNRINGNKIMVACFSGLAIRPAQLIPMWLLADRASALLWALCPQPLSVPLCHLRQRVAACKRTGIRHRGRAWFSDHSG